MKLYLVRHGETDKNKTKCLQGQSDTELNEYGRELARKTAEGLKDVAFDEIYTSPLKRARETAEIIRGDRDIPVYEEPAIIEIAFGAYEGCCYGKDGYNVPDPEFMNFFQAPEKYRAPEGGESFGDVIARTGRFLEGLAAEKKNKDKTILLSTHGCALKAMLAYLRKTPIENFWGEGVHKNCAVSLVEERNGVWQVQMEGKLYY